MEKLSALIVFLVLGGLLSCSPTSDRAVPDSTAIDSANMDSVAADSVPKVGAGIKDIETLLPQLPLLKFPVKFSVDSFRNQKSFPIAFDEASPWFTNSLDFSRGKKVAAIGKFYLDLKTPAVLFLISSPADFSDRPDDQGLLLSLFNSETGKVNSRIIAIGNADVYGNTVMKTPDKGKGFVHQEGAEINITLQAFEIKDGEFVLTKSDDKAFPGDQKGSDAAALLIKNWMK
jgi:hypothetical protein